MPSTETMIKRIKAILVGVPFLAALTVFVIATLLFFLAQTLNNSGYYEQPVPIETITTQP